MKRLTNPVTVRITVPVTKGCDHFFNVIEHHLRMGYGYVYVGMEENRILRPDIVCLKREKARDLDE